MIVMVSLIAKKHIMAIPTSTFQYYQLKISIEVNPYLITAGDFDGIIHALSDLEYEAGKDFACSPDFRDYKFLKKYGRRSVSCSRHQIITTGLEHGAVN